ncbi:MAG TPA: prepilin-type N-terminal cleavage/methylation domain-containing protein, partial [bacterium]
MTPRGGTREGQRGLTLIELVISIALLAVLGGIFYGMIVTVARGWGGLQGQLDVQQNPRIAVNRMMAEIGQARDFMIDSAGNTLSLVKGTILTADAAAGATTFMVEDASALTSGKPALLLNVLSAERVTISSISGTTVTVSPALTIAHKQGEAVRRDQTTVSGALSSGATSITVTSVTPFAVGDSIAIGNEAPLTVTAIGASLTVTPATGQAHSVGEVVQVVTVFFQLDTGTSQLKRCTSSCDNSNNKIVLADYAAAQVSLQLFTAVQTTLSVAAARGATSITVTNTANFAVNDVMQVGRDTYGAGAIVSITPTDRKRVRVITGGAGGSLTLCSPTYPASSCPASGNGSTEGLSAARA